MEQILNISNGPLMPQLKPLLSMHNIKSYLIFIAKAKVYKIHNHFDSRKSHIKVFWWVSKVNKPRSAENIKVNPCWGQTKVNYTDRPGLRVKWFLNPWSLASHPRNINRDKVFYKTHTHNGKSFDNIEHKYACSKLESEVYFPWCKVLDRISIIISNHSSFYSINLQCNRPANQDSNDLTNLSTLFDFSISLS